MLPDVGDHGVAEHERLAVPVLVQTLGNPLHRLGQPLVEVPHGVVELFLDVVLDVALHPLGVERAYVSMVRIDSVGGNAGRAVTWAPSGAGAPPNVQIWVITIPWSKS